MCFGIYLTYANGNIAVAYIMLLNLNLHQSIISKSQPFIDTGADL